MKSDYIDELEAGTHHDLNALDDLDATAQGAGVNIWLIVAGLAVVGILAGLVMFDGFEAETYFYDVDQAIAQGDDLVGQTVRIKGQVETGTVRGKDGDLGRTFRIAERGESIWVTYEGVLPDTFEEGVEVVAQGTVDEDYTLVADEVLVKCPSRYEGGPSSHPDDIPKVGPQASR